MLFLIFGLVILLLLILVGIINMLIVLSIMFIFWVLIRKWVSGLWLKVLRWLVLIFRFWIICWLWLLFCMVLWRYRVVYCCGWYVNMRCRLVVRCLMIFWIGNCVIG